MVNAGNLAFNMLFSRWMGPALFGDLASLLTLKLAALGVLGALQMAASRHSAAHPKVAPALATLNRIGFIALWCALPLVLLLIWQGELGARLGLQQPVLLLILALSLPFTAPLSLLRGHVHARMDLGGILASANAEMATRLFGAIAAWQMGLGLPGVTAAIALSIVAGWAVIANRLPSAPHEIPLAPLAKALGMMALPFAVLQAAQVALLDGEVITAKLLLGTEEAGYIAALSLFQRIEFFACFGMIGILLPRVATAATQNRPVLRTALPVLGVFAAVSATALTAATLAPNALITAMTGTAYLPAAPLLPVAALSAACFTLSYLLATFLAALGVYSGVWVIALFVPVQLGAFALLAAAPGSLALTTLLNVKLTCQISIATILLALSTHRLIQTRKAIQ
jgi:O-antigen/teichoic acid export membrane protein